MPEPEESTGREREAGGQWARAFLWGGALLLPFGLCLATVPTVWKRPDAGAAAGKLGFIDSLFSSAEGYVAVFFILLALGGICLGGRALPLITGSSPADSERLYNRFLIGVGYALFVCGVFCAALVGGFFFDEHMPMSAGAFAVGMAEDRQQLGRLIALSAAIAVLGALFFVGNSLRLKREGGVETFSVQKFWGGLWYRLGEAVLFSLVAFWLIWYNAERPAAATTTGPAQPPAGPLLGYGLLPVLSLLMGMFVTSGEKLIYGVARGLFRAAGAFFDSSDDGEREERSR